MMKEDLNLSLKKNNRKPSIGNSEEIYNNGNLENEMFKKEQAPKFSAEYTQGNMNNIFLKYENSVR
jgi:hypothetical protein